MSVLGIAGIAALMAVATALVTVAARPLLARASMRRRFLVVALLGTAAALANLALFVQLMLLKPRDALELGLLLVWSMAAGVGAALALARSSSRAVDRLVTTAGRLARGDLGARTGRLRAGPELDALAQALDGMAERLGDSLARERAVEAQRRDLITAVSHDLRTPLTGLRAIAESVEDGVVDDPATLRRYAAEMRTSVDTLVELVDDLFEFVQIDAGAIEAASPVPFGGLARSALAACEAQASEKGLVVEARLDGTGDTLCSPHLARVLQNLIQNAIRHTPADGTVRLEAARRDDGALEVVVEDTGEGIDPAVLARLFEPFWRGDAARSGAGSGLGLALARRIVEAMGGEIRVHSEPDRGARFAVLVPL